MNGSKTRMTPRSSIRRMPIDGFRVRSHSLSHSLMVLHLSLSGVSKSSVRELRAIRPWQIVFFFFFPVLAIVSHNTYSRKICRTKITKLFTSLKADSPDKSPRHCDSEVSFGSDQSQ